MRKGKEQTTRFTKCNIGFVLCCILETEKKASRIAAEGAIIAYTDEEKKIQH